jgi:two-component system sensor histidine kinase BaeS
MPRFPIGQQHGQNGPPWWPGQASWPGHVGPGWPDGRRIRRLMLAMSVVFVFLPLALGAVLAAGFAGWAGAAVVVFAAIALLIVGSLFARFAWRSIRSVNELVNSTGRLSDGDYSVRMSPTPSQAFRPAVDSFNRMAERLETSDDLRRRLLADVGHELRTPLTIIRGELEAMADGVRELSEKEVRRLLGDVANMERLLEDLKTLSTTEAGVLDLHREPTDVASLVEKITARFQTAAADRDVRLTLSSDPSSSAVSADLDQQRIEEVVANLIMNALRAVSPGGRINLRVTQDHVGDQQRAVIEVVDDGVGIPAEQLDLVFDRFHKGAESNGSGLGLTISRELVLAHGGTISVASDTGIGTTFTVSLRLNS